jgi:hypothetical protein
MKTKKSELEKIQFHTTLTREIRPDLSWHELIKSWQRAATLGDMLGILYRGFDVKMAGSNWFDEPKYDDIDRLTFYFTIADGWNDERLLELPVDDGLKYYMGFDRHRGMVKDKSPAQLRQMLARKAFDVLCSSEFFKTELMSSENCRGKEYNEVWIETITSTRLFPVIQNFFRINEQGKIRNLTWWNEKRPHSEIIAIDFLLNLAQFIFDWQERDTDFRYSNDEKKEIEKQDAEIRSRLDKSRPWMVEILSELDRLDILQKRIFKLDQESLKKLEEIAMRSKFSEYRSPVLEDRLAITLNEACYLGSKTAWLLKEHELMIRERDRLQNIHDAKQKREEADRELAKLSQK